MILGVFGFVGRFKSSFEPFVEPNPWGDTHLTRTFERRVDLANTLACVPPFSGTGFDNFWLAVCFGIGSLSHSRCFACLGLDFLVCCSGALPFLWCCYHFGVWTLTRDCIMTRCVSTFQRKKCACSKRRSQWSLQLAVWIFAFANFRIGEARVPGPSEASWTIGTCNPAGLPNKAHLIGDSQTDLWLISETHLSYQGCQKFKHQLQQMQSPYRWIVPGKHVMPRSTTSDLGSWSGVAALSKHPTRRLSVPWGVGAVDTSRIVACTSYIANFWLSGCVVYGVPAGPSHPRAKKVTDALLHEAVRHLGNMTGPRFLAGDFNHDLSSLSSIETLTGLKFIEVQNLHFLKTGLPPQPTSQRKVRRDFLFISPELIPLCTDVVVNHDRWVDHATIEATFVGGQHELLRFPWPKPKPLPWQMIQLLDDEAFPLPCFDTTANCTRAYQDFWKTVEQQVAHSSAKVGTPVFKTSFGRGARHSPQKVHGQQAPLKAGRQGEVVPNFFGFSHLHKHWFRQLRRLQSYMHLAKGFRSTANVSEHQASLWGAILRAPGFVPTFQEWWTTRPAILFPDALVTIVPPTLDQAEKIFKDLESQVRLLEKQLNKKNVATDPQTHLANLYRAVKRDAPEQVDVIFQNKVSKVERVCNDDCSIVVNPPQPWDEDRPILVHGHKLSPIVVTSDQIWVESIENLEVGQAVVQAKPIGKLDVVFEQFIQYWQTFWCKHADVPLAQWENILAFARRKIIPCKSKPLSLDEAFVRASAKAKKNHAAIGLDGVSKADVVHLTPKQLNCVIAIFRRAGLTGEWPSQVLEGVVKSLAKRDNPQDVPDFRPITVFPFIYRLWSSMASKFWLGAIDETLDPLLCGNRNQYQAGTLWRRVMEEVELAQLHQHDLAGLVLDLTKAYNTLPRLPCLGIALISGVDQPTLNAWASALNGMSRRFWVNGSVSRGIPSNRGYPEGCGMSCLAMLLLTQLWHEWVHDSCQMCKPMSFVDNWEVLCNSAESVKQAFQKTLEFTRALDISVDAQKTFTWAVQAQDRKLLRQDNFNVVHDIRDLGAHAVFSLQIRNATVLGRFKDLDQFWDKLHFVKSSFANKVRLIKTAGWPRALHAISGSLVGKKHFHDLRCKACRALGFDKPGCNRFVLALLSQFDPHYLAIVQTLRDWKQLGRKSHQEDMFACQHDVTGSNVGKGTLTQVFVQRLQILGWELVSAETIRDHTSSCFNLHGNWSGVMQRLSHAWVQVVASQVHQRCSFEQFQHVDLMDTQQHVATFEPVEQGILRNLLSGVMLTHDNTYHWSDSGATTCPACGCHDSLSHRFWKCDASADLRAQLPPDVVEIIDELPKVLTCHGWSISSPHGASWLAELDSIPDVIPEAPQLETDLVDLFTDGSCLWPTQPFRVAAWSVVFAPKPTLSFSATETQVLGVGHLPGRCQSAFRAELFALVVALSWVAEWQIPTRIWIDCQGVIDKFLLLTAGKRKLDGTGRNNDLWTVVQGLVNSIQVQVQLIKVDSHQQWERETPELLRWVRINNACADRAAGVANQQRSSQFWRIWEAHSAFVLKLQHIAQQVRNHLVRVSKRWTENFSLEGPTVLPPRPPRLGKVFTMRWVNAGKIFELPGAMQSMFGVSFTTKLIHWWNNIIEDERLPDRWVSFAQLYLTFQQDERHPGVCKKKRQWLDPDTFPMLMPEQISFRKRCRFFRLSLQQLWKFCGFEIGVATTRPCSTALSCHIGCTSIPVKTDRLSELESWLQLKLAGPVKQLGKDLDKIPAAW